MTDVGARKRKGDDMDEKKTTHEKPPKRYRATSNGTVRAIVVDRFYVCAHPGQAKLTSMCTRKESMRRYVQAFHTRFPGRSLCWVDITSQTESCTDDKTALLPDYRTWVRPQDVYARFPMAATEEALDMKAVTAAANAIHVVLTAGDKVTAPTLVVLHCRVGGRRCAAVAVVVLLYLGLASSLKDALAHVELCFNAATPQQPQRSCLLRDDIAQLAEWWSGGSNNSGATSTLSPHSSLAV
jgi:hypothetical protein